MWKAPVARRTVLFAGIGLRAQDWVSLFDGNSTAGWMPVAGDSFPTDCWRVEDGCLKAVVHQPTFQDIRTEREFGDFELVFHWKIAPGGNCGVKYLISKYDSWMPKGVSAARPQARARGCEYQLTDDERSAEAKRDPTRGTASLYSKAAPTQPPLRPAGAFNESKIVVRKPSIEHWLNGRLVLSLRLEEKLPERSAIALQNHQSECWFRSIRIRSL
ncbi:MAG: DUF1080 domain-containing protein [Acidobacteria bacterium]|nr:DUF1080 domain-containing protein [Acidobacteriota bacterium]